MTMDHTIAGHVNSITAQPQSLNTAENSTQYIYSPGEKTEGIIMFVVAVFGSLGNLIVMATVMCCRKLRKSSSAFLCHHCFLDFIKSLFCIPYGYSLLTNREIYHCYVTGAAYILLMTLSAYNLIAILINEEYSLLNNKKQLKGDYCCIIFGIFMIWFTTILIHLGVAVIPRSTEYDPDIGNCVFEIGLPSHYVIHVLWSLMVTGALIVSICTSVQFYRRLKTQSNSQQWMIIHKSISMDINAEDMSDDIDVDDNFQYDDVMKLKAIKHYRIYMNRAIIILIMIISFMVFWYPLFLVTLFDIHYSQPTNLYRLLTIFAWTHPVTTPIFCGIILRGVLKTEIIVKEVYSNTFPMTQSSSKEEFRHKIHTKFKTYETGYYNDNFEFTPTHKLHNRRARLSSVDDGSDSERIAMCDPQSTPRKSLSTVIF